MKRVIPSELPAECRTRKLLEEINDYGKDVGRLTRPIQRKIDKLFNISDKSLRRIIGEPEYADAMVLIDRYFRKLPLPEGVYDKIRKEGGAQGASAILNLDAVFALRNGYETPKEVRENGGEGEDTEKLHGRKITDLDKVFARRKRRERKE